MKIMEFLESQEIEIKDFFNDNEFLIFENIIAIGNSDNVLSLNFFALGIRELIRIFLSRNVSDEDIKKCVWYNELKYFDKEKNKEIITRKQRMVYIICGGISLDEIKENLELDILEYAQELNSIEDTLSKYAHFNKCNEIENKEIIMEEIIKILITFLSNMRNFKKNFEEKYYDFIDSVVDEKFKNETMNDIDILATHYFDPEFTLGTLNFIKADSEIIKLEATGRVSVIHQYGSDYDNRMGDGATFSSEYPVNFTIEIDAEDAFTGNISIVDIQTETKSFYE